MNNATTAIGTMKLIQSLALPLGDSLTKRFAYGKIKNNISNSNTAPAIFKQSIITPTKKIPRTWG
jgi:hypothetical protein